MPDWATALVGTKDGGGKAGRRKVEGPPAATSHLLDSMS